MPSLAFYLVSSVSRTEVNFCVKMKEKKSNYREGVAQYHDLSGHNTSTACL